MYHLAHEVERTKNNPREIWIGQSFTLMWEVCVSQEWDERGREKLVGIGGLEFRIEWGEWWFV